MLPSIKQVNNRKEIVMDMPEFATKEEREDYEDWYYHMRKDYELDMEGD